MLAAISDSSPMIAIIFSSELERRDRAGRSGASGDDMSPSGALPGPGRTERLPAVPPEPTNEDAQVFYRGTGSQGRCGHVSRFGADGPERAPGVGTVGLPASAMPARSLQLLLRFGPEERAHYIGVWSHGSRSKPLLGVSEPLRKTRNTILNEDPTCKQNRTAAALQRVRGELV